MERTSSSTRTMNVYGHCHTSMLVERGYEISQRIVQGEEYQGRGRITQHDLDALQVDDLHPFNDFTVEEKLDIALAMAEGIAVMHGHEEGVIVNDDGKCSITRLFYWLWRFPFSHNLCSPMNDSSPSLSLQSTPINGVRDALCAVCTAKLSRVRSSS